MHLRMEHFLYALLIVLAIVILLAIAFPALLDPEAAVKIGKTMADKAPEAVKVGKMIATKGG